MVEVTSEQMNNDEDEGCNAAGDGDEFGPDAMLSTRSRSGVMPKNKDFEGRSAQWGDSTVTVTSVKPSEEVQGAFLGLQASFKLIAAYDRPYNLMTIASMKTLDWSDSAAQFKIAILRFKSSDMKL